MTKQPKTLFIQAKQKNLNITLSKAELKKLPKKILLLYSIQYKPLAESIKTQLQKSKIKIQKFQQVLGCSKISNPNKLPILLISTGRFHAQNLYLQAPIIYILENNKIIQIPQSEISEIKTKRKTALLKFLSADKLGILVSTKPGQENLKNALKIKQKIEKKPNNQKKVYLFISNNIGINQFENFNIDSWINTACPGLIVDNPCIINYDELPNT